MDKNDELHYTVRTGKPIRNSPLEQEIIDFFNKIYDLSFVWCWYDYDNRYPARLYLASTDRKALERSNIAYDDSSGYNMDKQYYKEMVCNFAEFLRSKDMDVNPITSLTIYSLETINNSYCIYSAKDKVRRMVANKYKSYAINVFPFSGDPLPSNNFVFWSSSEFERAKEIGLFEELRSKSYEIVKKYDKLGYFTPENYVTRFHDRKNLTDLQMMSFWREE